MEIKLDSEILELNLEEFRQFCGNLEEVDEDMERSANFGDWITREYDLGD